MLKRIAELDGLRGATALMVVVAHYLGEPPHGWPGLMWGWLGVGMFFVLSGFLIGGGILDGCRTPNFLPNFYLRRAARIVPPYVLVILASFGVAWLFRSRPWCDQLLPLSYYATFTQNFAIAAHQGGGLWLLPTWTVAVEEQFYLLIPFVILFSPRRWLAPVLIALWTGAILFRLCLLDHERLAALTLLPGRMDLLLSGVLAAVLQRRMDLTRHLLWLRTIPLICALGLLGLSLLDRDRAFQIAAPAVLGIGGASFLLALVHGAPEGARFRSPRLRSLGRISYSVYLLHQPVSGLIHGVLFNTTPDVGSVPRVLASILAFVITIALAQLCSIYLEIPLQRAARRLSAAEPGSAADFVPTGPSSRPA